MLGLEKAIIYKQPFFTFTIYKYCRLSTHGNFVGNRVIRMAEYYSERKQQFILYLQV